MATYTKTIMKAYMSYSSRGYQEPSDFLISLVKLSFFYSKKHFKEVHFFTDSQSKDFFKDIKWDSVSTELDNVPKDYPEVWSLSKLYAYKAIAKKGDPFIHIDNDVILYKALPQELLSSEVFAQSPEKFELKYLHLYMTDLLIEKCPNLHLLKNMPGNAYNMGIFGGNNLGFIEKYVDDALKFLYDPENEYFWKKFKNEKNSWWKAVVLEQLFLAGAENFYNQKITCLFEDKPLEEDCQTKGYAHLMNGKKDPEIQEKIKIIAKLLNL